MKRPRPTKRKLENRLDNVETKIETYDPLQGYFSSYLSCWAHGLKEQFERQGFEVTIEDDHGDYQLLETNPPFGEATRPLAFWNDNVPTANPHLACVIWDGQERPDEAVTVSTYDDCEVVIHEDVAITNAVMSVGDAEREGYEIIREVEEPVCGTSGGETGTTLVEVKSACPAPHDSS